MAEMNRLFGNLRGLGYGLRIRICPWRERARNQIREVKLPPEWPFRTSRGRGLRNPSQRDIPIYVRARSRTRPGSGIAAGGRGSRRATGGKPRRINWKLRCRSGWRGGSFYLLVEMPRGGVSTEKLFHSRSSIAYRYESLHEPFCQRCSRI